MKLAIYQADAAARSPEQRLQDLRQQLELHQHQLPELLICPELYLSGYGSAEDIRAYATSVESELMLEFGRVAAEFGIALVIGYPEHINQVICNSAAVFSAAGAVIANHRKRVLPTDYEEELFSCGEQPTLCELGNGWKVGVVICYETEIPEAVRQCAVAGAHLVVAPTALGRQWSMVSRKVIPTRAFENNVFLAYANYCGKDSMSQYIGDSVIVSPMGDDLIRADESESWIEASLEISDIPLARDRLRYLRDCRVFE